MSSTGAQNNKVIVVGAGIAGLSAGIYAAQSGFDVTIFESHTIPGGNCTGWKRKGYFFEGGLHWLTGSAENQPLYQVWRNVGAIDDETQIIKHDPYFSYDYQGQMVYLYRDLDKLRQHWLEVSPADAKAIKALCREVKSFSRIAMPTMDIKGVKVKEKGVFAPSMLPALLPALPKMASLNRITAGEYSERFTHPALRGMLQNVVGTQFNATSLLFTLATFAAGDGGYLKGGSVEMAARMARRFCDLGGQIHYASPVERVMVENGIATGVIVNGASHPADAVIVTQDTLAAKDHLFDPPLNEPWMQKMQSNCETLTCIYLSLGVKADLSHLPPYLFLSLDKPLSFAGLTTSTLWVCQYAYFKEYAPPGCTALISSLDGDSYDFWKQCRVDGSYEEQKQQIASQLIAAITSRIPGIDDKIEVIDVATPLTYERYCGTYRGSWMTLTGAGAPNITYPHASESVKGLYFAGQRLQPPGGLPVAVTSGRTAAQHLCRDTNRIFQGAS
ncbi:MAG: NAD(P)/FAD-dependent oxidoreductase [Coriobacteriia bacterium]|nr:NAD(P)/FAD-dependent oxidoreductase [Coriobacteriia bacterium]